MDCNVYLFIGLFMIVTGFLVQFFPKGIDSYQCTPKKNRKDIDLKGLSHLVRNAFLAQGLMTIIASLWGYGKYVFAPTLVIAIIIIKIKEQKYFKRIKK